MKELSQYVKISSEFGQDVINDIRSLQNNRYAVELTGFASGFSANGPVKCVKNIIMKTVVLFGRINIGKTYTSGEVIFTLPEGFRPTYQQFFPADYSGGAAVRLNVLTSGAVVVHGALANGSIISISGITFDIT